MYTHMYTYAYIHYICISIHMLSESGSCRFWLQLVAAVEEFFFK